MFCIYKEGAVQSIMHGNKAFIAEDGTQHGRDIFTRWTDIERSNLNIYRFTDQTKEGYNKDFYTSGIPSDSAPVDYTITRSSSPVPKTNLDALKEALKSRVVKMRSQVARAGVIFSTKNFDTDSKTVESINLIGTALLDGNSFSEGVIPWDTMDTDKVPKETFNATEEEFKALRNAIATHFVLCSKQAKIHLDAIDALTTFNAIITYDYSTGWPITPDTSF